MGFLLDTNVLSEPQRPRPSAAVLAWFESVPSAELWTSALVVGELQKGVELLRRRDAARAARLDDWLGRLVRVYADRILPVTVPVAEEWGRMNVPDPLPVVDGYLAATARAHGLTLATRNLKDVERTGVSLINPFDWPVR
ncbi:type II toxin-antitoxin system VapC family toxin [Streptacidiphilus sp. PAMC 29251]